MTVTVGGVKTDDKIGTSKGNNIFSPDKTAEVNGRYTDFKIGHTHGKND